MKCSRFVLGLMAAMVAVLATTSLASAQGSAAAGFEGDRPVAVSPGNQLRMTSNVQRCPTFSWGVVEGAVAYELVVLEVGSESAADRLASAADSLQSENAPSIRVTLPGSASSWTPPSDLCLEPGGQYLWYLRETDELGTSFGEWSEGSWFQVRNSLSSSSRAIRHAEGEVSDEMQDDLERELRRLAEVDLSRWREIDALVRLDDAEWELLNALMALDPENWQLLDGYLEADGEALLSPDGRVLRSTDPVEGENAVLVSKSFITDALTSILSRVKSIQSGVSNLTNQLGQVRDTIPDRTRIQALLEDLLGVGNRGSRLQIGALEELVAVLKDEVGGVLDQIEFLRQDFALWQSDNCGPGCGITIFKQELGGVFDQLSGVWESVQRLQCLTDGQAQIQSLAGFGEGEFFRTLLIDKPPPLVLYALASVLSKVDGWQNAVGELLARIPSQLLTFCDEGGAIQTSAFADVSFKMASCPKYPKWRRCAALRAPRVRALLERLRMKLNVGLFAFELSESWTTPDKVIAINVVGGGGTNAPNPVHSWPKTIKLITKKLDDLAASLLSEGEACLKADEALERDLVTCKPEVDYFLEEKWWNVTLPGGATVAGVHGGRKGELFNLACRRWDELEEAGYNLSPFQTRFDAADDFNELCAVYGEALRSLD